MHHVEETEKFVKFHYFRAVWQ